MKVPTKLRGAAMAPVDAARCGPIARGHLLEEEAGEALPVFGGIGTYAETGLHAALKARYAGPEGRQEVELEGKVVDLVRTWKGREEVVEIQTRNLNKITPKVLDLARGHKVRLVHPIIVETRIVRLSPETGEVLSERKSPKAEDLYSLFDELVMAPALIGARNVEVELAFVRCRELRSRDGTGSWRRRGDRIVARDLLEFLDTRTFSTPATWRKVIPAGLPPPWHSAALGEALGIGADRARKVLYAYAKAGLLADAGKDGRKKLYGPPAKGPARRTHP